MYTLLLTLSIVSSGNAYCGVGNSYYSNYAQPYYYPPPIVKFFAVEPNQYYLDIVSGGQRQNQQQQTVNQFIQTLEQFNQNMKQRHDEAPIKPSPVDPDDVPIPVSGVVAASPPPTLRKPGWVPPPIEVVSTFKNDCAKCHSAPKPNKGFKIFEANGQMSILTGEQKIKIDGVIANREMPPSGKDVTAVLPKYREWIYQDPAVIDYLKKRSP